MTEVQTFDTVGHDSKTTVGLKKQPFRNSHNYDVTGQNHKYSI